VLRFGRVFPRAIRVIEVGERARRSIERASAATVVAALSRSVYLEVAGGLVWLGGPGSSLHARAIITADPPALEQGRRVETSFDLGSARQWRPPVPRAIDLDALIRESRRLLALVGRLGRPDGFGALLVGEPLSFPLNASAAGRARGFLHACAAGDPGTAVVLAGGLLGLGPGLTPAGDDLVGGAFFARRLVGATDGWDGAATSIKRRARERTHPISATLLGDLLEGSGHAPLHELVVALCDGDVTSALDAAARLVKIGHSSGWDMLTGFLGALSTESVA
jgi:Protein of unknown function (DUF2877)